MHIKSINNISGLKNITTGQSAYRQIARSVEPDFSGTSRKPSLPLKYLTIMGVLLSSIFPAASFVAPKTVAAQEVSETESTKEDTPMEALSRVKNDLAIQLLKFAKVLEKTLLDFVKDINSIDNPTDEQKHYQELFNKHQTDLLIITKELEDAGITINNLEKWGNKRPDKKQVELFTSYMETMVFGPFVQSLEDIDNTELPNNIHENFLRNKRGVEDETIRLTEIIDEIVNNENFKDKMIQAGIEFDSDDGWVLGLIVAVLLSEIIQ